MTRFQVVWTLIAIASLFSTGCGSDESAVQTNPSANSQGTEENIYVEPEENEDTLGIVREAQHYASDFEVSEEEALGRFNRSDELTAMLQEIVAAETGRVAGWGLVHEPEFGG